MSIFNRKLDRYKPYISRSLNIEYMNANFTKESLEKVCRKYNYEIDRRKKMSTIVDEIYDLIVWNFSTNNFINYCSIHWYGFSHAPDVTRNAWWRRINLLMKT